MAQAVGPWQQARIAGGQWRVAQSIEQLLQVLFVITMTLCRLTAKRQDLEVKP